jgi:hypothetical protein
LRDCGADYSRSSERVGHGTGVGDNPFRSVHPIGTFGRVGGRRIHALLLGSLRCAWVCCLLAMAAMLPALILRSTTFVAAFQYALLACFVALAAAVLLGAVALTLPDAQGIPLGRGLGQRAATLVAVVLADLLDRD